MNDVVLNNLQSIQRCARWAREEFAADPKGFDTNFTRQDAAILNVLRACEQTIDLVNHVIKSEKLSIPTSSSESFDLLREAGIIEQELAEKLQRMVGFRNTVVHHYQRLDVAIVRSVISSGLDDLLLFSDRIREHLQN